MSDLLIKNLKLPKEDRIQLSVYPDGKVINHSSFTDTTLLAVVVPSRGMKTKYCLTCPVEACGGLEFNPFTELLECPVFNITTRYDNKTTMTNPNAMYGYVSKDKED